MTASDRFSDLFRAVLKDRLPIIPFTSAEALIYARIQGKALRAGATRPVIDVCIAATAIAQSLTLVTLNTRNLRGIDRRAVEGWE